MGFGGCQPLGFPSSGGQNRQVLEVLSAELARRNPKAYIAHFQRLDPEAQRAWVGGLTAEEHALHVAVVGEAVALGLRLTVTGDDIEFAATLAGGALGSARGWEAAKALQDSALARGRALGGALTVTGLLHAPLEELERVALDRLGWRIRAVELWPGLCGGPASWRVQGEVAGGSFWSPAAVAPGDEAALERRLRALAERLHLPLRVARHG